ncbi:DUF4263 domain-containing protein [Mesorhizobium sp. LMG 17147]|uniref:Shedu immune nuclease family protein n=1 Tax=Mesorhizobium sp. LMG 17147 TaxID=2963091 RepID=UPI0020C9CF89|nr:Shedu immune nuclease family protein [Mesorhizobium sp. LMG 17147]MCP9230512.1 DUF4263 domain-containing protein [Mesorhizobium sp. LMG 17147]
MDSSATDAPEAEIIDRHRLDHLYTHAFRNGAGKFFTVVSSDVDGLPLSVEADHPIPTRNKIKTTLTFVRSEHGGAIKYIEMKRFQYFARAGYVEQAEGIRFSFSFFVGLIGFLQGLAGLDLNSLNERRIPLADNPALDADTMRSFRTLIATAEGQELVTEAVRNGHITSADLVNVGYRKAQLSIFESLLHDEAIIERYRQDYCIGGGLEAIWQHFFEANTWIFGYGLDFVFNCPLDGKRLQQTVHGFDFAGSGKIADGVLKTAGIISSLCLVEIKTPKADLVERHQYRSDCWQASRELSGGIAQAQKTVQKTIENVALSPVLRSTNEQGAPTGEVVHSYQPRSYLIIGSLAEFRTNQGINHEKFASFELLRRHTRQPEIITFDELLERAKFIVAKT